MVSYPAQGVPETFCLQARHGAGPVRWVMLGDLVLLDINVSPLSRVTDDDHNGGEARERIFSTVEPTEGIV